MPDHAGPVPAARRAAAVVALLAPPAALLVALSAITSGALWALATALCVLLAAGFAWLMLTRRGLLRVLSGLGVLVAVVALVVFQVLHWRSTLIFLLLLGLLAVFGAAGRYALGSAAAGKTLPAGVRRVGAAKHGVLIVNPRSGNGKAGKFDLPGEAARRGIDVVLLEPGNDLRELAERAIARGADVIGMAGGDGSQAIVAAAAMRHGVAHVCIPSGTRNHFALDLGLNRDDVVGALDAYTDGAERRIDLAEVNDHVFVNNASLGVYARVVQSGSYRDAKLLTWARLLPDLLGPDADPIDLQFVGPDGTRYTDAELVLVSNNPYQVDQLAAAGTRPRMDTGMLGVVVARIRDNDGAEPTTLTPLLSGLVTWTGTDFEVTSGAPVPVGLDGEAVTVEPPLRFRSLPGALRVRVPRHASGCAPPVRTVALSRDDLAALLTVALGRPRRDGTARSHP